MTNELVEKESNTDVAKVTPSPEEMAERVRDLATKLHSSAQVDAIRALAAKFGELGTDLRQDVQGRELKLPFL